MAAAPLNRQPLQVSRRTQPQPPCLHQQRRNMGRGAETAYQRVWLHGTEHNQAPPRCNSSSTACRARTRLGRIRHLHAAVAVRHGAGRCFGMLHLRNAVQAWPVCQTGHAWRFVPTRQRRHKNPLSSPKVCSAVQSRIGSRPFAANSVRWRRNITSRMLPQMVPNGNRISKQ
jgi:hypothetical protein